MGVIRCSDRWDSHLLRPTRKNGQNCQEFRSGFFGRGRTLKFPPSPRARSVPESENLATPRFGLLIGESGFDGASGEEKAGQDQRTVCFVWTGDGPGEGEIVDDH